MNHNVFVCYSAKDKAVAEKVVSELEARGIKCWIALRDIKPGTPWGRAILEAIESSQIVVLILSENSNSSSQVAREIERAISIGLDVIPFRIEDMNPSGALSYFLSTAHWIDGFPSQLERYFDELIETINIFLGNETEVGAQDHNNTKKVEQSKKQEKKRGLIKRLFRKEEKEEGYDLIPVVIASWDDVITEGGNKNFKIAYTFSASQYPYVRSCICPVTGYAKASAEGAKTYGEDFYRLWQATTHYADGKKIL